MADKKTQLTAPTPEQIAEGMTQAQNYIVVKPPEFNDLTFSWCCANARIAAAKSDFKEAIRCLLNAERADAHICYLSDGADHDRDFAKNRKAEIAAIVECINDEICSRM
jgi:ferritin-like protein